MNPANEAISLLWPDATAQRPETQADPDYAGDVGLDELAGALSIAGKYRKFVKGILAGLCRDKEVIEYRQDILDDLLRNVGLARDLRALLPMIAELSACREQTGLHATPLMQAMRRFGELELYVQCVGSLSGALERCGESLESQGLLRVKRAMDEVASTESFLSLKQSIPELKSGMERMASVTIGVNLDAQLRPVEATILSLNDTAFKGCPLLNSFFARGGAVNGSTGISELHSIVEKSSLTQMDILKSAVNEDHALQIMLFNDLHAILNRSLAPVVSTMKQYTHVNSGLLTHLEYELAFLLGAAALAAKLGENGLATCRPAIADMDRRVLRAQGCYSVNLALRLIESGGKAGAASLVANDIDFDEGGAVFVLTGPNRGGKTTYLQTIAVFQLLAQSGALVPASCAAVSPADRIFTHFPVEEKPDEDGGRLGEEAARLADIYRMATAGSLVLLNESISSTSPSENLQISRDVLLGLKLMGLRAVFATHLHELGEGLDELNARLPRGSKAVSIVAGAERGGGNEARRTFKVARARPAGSSFAADIAEKYGLGRNQIVRTLVERKLLDEKDADIV